MHQRCLWRLAFAAEKCLRRRATLQLRKQGTAVSGRNVTPRTPSDPTLPPNSCPTPTPPCRDPFTFLAPQLSELRTSLLFMLSSGHPAISEITKYYFKHPSKQVRPVIVLLLSQATNGLGGDWDRKLWEAHSVGAGGLAKKLDKPLTRPDVLNDWNPSMPDETTPFNSTFPLKPSRIRRYSRILCYLRNYASPKSSKGCIRPRCCTTT
jgi:hexaprenyl-diphosphate synthase